VKRDPHKILADLAEADREVDRLKGAYEDATERRAALVWEAADFPLPRSTIARDGLNGKSVTRAQQIIDRVRGK
jgi:hypothetical protein